jgi:mannonate dehydratase
MLEIAENISSVLSPLCKSAVQVGVYFAVDGLPLTDDCRAVERPWDLKLLRCMQARRAPTPQKGHARRAGTRQLACAGAHRDIAAAEALWPDHVPALEGDSNGNAGYSSSGRPGAIGHIRGPRQAFYVEQV